MIEDISFINNIKNFKQSLFQGTIFKFSRSEKAIELINSIKKEIHSHYAKNLDILHLEKNAELIAKNLIKTLKNQDSFLKNFKEILKEINFNINECYRDKFVVRVAPAELNKATYEASRIGIHRDTWGTNIFQQIIGGLRLIL